MKSKKYRDLALLMNQESLIAYSSLLNSLASALSYANILETEIAQDEDAYEDLMEKAVQVSSMIYPYILASKPGEEKLHALMDQSKVMEECVQEGIDEVLSYREEQNDVKTSCFSPFGMDKEFFEDLKYEFLIRILKTYRLKDHLNDMAKEMLEYGKECFVVPEENKSQLKLFDGIEEMKDNEILDELYEHLAHRCDDLDEDYDDKDGLLSLIEKIEK